MVRNQTLSDHNQINLATFALVLATRERLEIAVSPIKKTTYEFLASGLIMEAPGIEPVAQHSQVETEKQLAPPLLFPLAPYLALETQIDPELARLIHAWPALPETLKIAVRVIVHGVLTNADRCQEIGGD